MTNTKQAIEDVLSAHDCLDRETVELCLQALKTQEKLENGYAMVKKNTIEQITLKWGAALHEIVVLETGDIIAGIVNQAMISAQENA